MAHSMQALIWLEVVQDNQAEHSHQLDNQVEQPVEPLTARPEHVLDVEHWQRAELAGSNEFLNEIFH